MTARPILFSAPMVRALLEGRKTQTRRVVKPQPETGKWIDECNFVASGFSTWKKFDTAAGCECRDVKCPYGKPGDLLWLREAFGVDLSGGFFYRATDSEGDGDDFDNPWKPSIHMPRRASRLTLEITRVRVERLQAVTELDAYAEGIDTENDPTYLAAAHFLLAGAGSIRGGSPAVCAYADLWESLHGVGSWDENPHVWVIEFLTHHRNVDAAREMA